ncbi:MAG: hypothetical protein KIT22_02830 [Verrucomicrobiae bacterium]|nr:hypothetical protein [Verrucomicrobiae bacterium]
MAESRGTLATIAEGAATLLQPLEDRVSGGDLRLLLAELGLNFPASADGNAALTNASQSAVQRLKDLPPLVTALAQAVRDENVGQILSKSVELANAVGNLVKDFETLGTAIRNLPGTGIPAAELNQFAAQLPGRLVDYLVVRNLEGIGGAAEALDFIGFIERTDVPAAGPQHPAFTRRALHLDQLTDFLTDPAKHLKNKYQWGDPAFTGVPLLQKIASLLSRAGVPAILDTSGPVPVLDVLFLEVSPKLDQNPKGLILRIAHPLEINTAQPWVQDDWQFKLILNTQLKPGVEVILQPDDGISLRAAGGTQVQGDLTLEWTGGQPNGAPYVILGEPGGSRLEARQFIARAGVGFAWNSAQGRGEGTLKIAGEIKGGKLVVSLANADGFLGKILSGFGLESDFDVGLGYSTREGIFFAGSATLDIQLPLHLQLGPVEVSALTLTVGFAGNTFPIGLRANLKAALGPLEAVVEQIGVGADLAVPEDKKGNAGPIDFHLRFLPPKGVGLSLDVEVVKGGGYLFIDPERGEYAGALELALFNVVTIKAIGIITTKMPDGSKGFSLLILMSVEFGTGIQLGFGFTLLAVGGLLGLNRTMKLQALADGVRTGGVESVMFPKDIIANAPKIISDLRAFFPPQEGRFLIGPMVKIGWGTPTLISLSLGIIIEIPGNIAIVGILQVALPTADAALIKLQVNFIGAIEFDKKRIWFFAALFDSRVLFLTIEGEMGLLMAFGDDANFVVSVGGFHPRYSPPPLPFPSPRRIAISLLNTPIARIRIEGYFAVTSNTVQFGARVEVFFGLDILNVQGHLAFDALFQFSPFYFIIEISASFSVKVFGAGLFSVRARGTLEGPAPWHIEGHGSISILFWDIDVDFEKTWGENRKEELPPIAVLPLLQDELNKPDNWRAFLPAGTSLLVSLRKMPEAEAALILHPVGILRVSQRAVPLQLKLDKVGTRKPGDVHKLFLSVTGGGLAKKADTFEPFAPAQYQNFSDADKVSRPAFAPERSGMDLSTAGEDLRSSKMVRRVVLYEEIIIDNNYKRFKRRFRGFFGSLFEFFLNGAAITRCELSNATKKKLLPFEEKITVQEETFTVAFQSNNKAFASDALSFHSEASAREYLNGKIAEDPNLAEQIHVIPSFERAA